jgi:hypothetical protein
MEILEPFRRNTNMRHNYWLQFKMSEGRRAQINLLDGRKLDIIVQPRLYVEELFNIVASHCDLKDPDKQYFGLVFIDEL